LCSPLGRRTHKSGTGVTEAYSLNDGDDEIVEYDSGNHPTALYVPGPAIDEPIAMVTKDGSGNFTVHKYFHTNHQGSVIAMSDDSGALSEGPYTYDPYGNCFSGGSACSGGVPYRFTGRRFDPETGLYYYRARYYWPQGGRFLQTDPVGYTADLNLYTYVGNDPLNFNDPAGKYMVIVGDAAYRSAVNAALTKLGKTPTGARLITQAQRSKFRDTISQVEHPQKGAAGDKTQWGTGTWPGVPGPADVRFYPHDSAYLEGVVGSEPAFVALGHELKHAVAMNSGTQPSPAKDPLPMPGTTPPSEQGATDAENAIRMESGLPIRGTYYPPLPETITVTAPHRENPQLVTPTSNSDSGVCARDRGGCGPSGGLGEIWGQ